MLLEGNTNIVKSVERGQRAGEVIELLEFFSGHALVISCRQFGFYKNKNAVSDPLGNGLIDMADIPVQYQLNIEHEQWTTEHSSGFIGLSNHCTLLILPTAIRLYASKSDALRNRNPIVELSLQ